VTVETVLDRAFAEARRDGRGVLIPYLVGGFPAQDAFPELAVAVLEAGADVLEIGIPFSDPLLDGPVIQHSQQQALAAGVTPRDCLRLAAQVHRRSDKPLLFMGAYNPVLAYGTERFAADAAEAGAAGLIIPDLPYEEQDELRHATQANDLHLIQLVAPTSTQERLRRVCGLASGFVYCISVTGVTGARASVAGTARPLVEHVKACTDVPVAVGFGIAGPDAAREVAEFADGVAVGSALVKIVADDERRGVEGAVQFIRSLREALSVGSVGSRL